MSIRVHAQSTGTGTRTTEKHKNDSPQHCLLAEAPASLVEALDTFKEETEEGCTRADGAFNDAIAARGCILIFARCGHFAARAETSASTTLLFAAIVRMKGQTSCAILIGIMKLLGVHRTKDR